MPTQNVTAKEKNKSSNGWKQDRRDGTHSWKDRATISNVLGTWHFYVYYPSWSAPDLTVHSVNNAPRALAEAKSMVEDLWTAIDEVVGG